MSRGLAIGARRDFEANHGGPSDHPIAHRLGNAAWGYPLRDLYGVAAINSPANRTFRQANGFSAGQSGTITAHVFPFYADLASNRPVTILAFVWLTSTSTQGIAVEVIDTGLADTGLGVGIGATAPNANGNNICGVRGGINYSNAGGQAIGTGLHSIGYSTDGSSLQQWWIDGRRVSTTGTGASYNIGGTGRTVLALLNHSTQSSWPRAGFDVGFAAAWARVLAPDEMATMHVDPFCIVRT